MLHTSVIRELYAKIQTQLFYMIPEKWDRIYLYSSVIEQVNHLQTGEMFFYYFPKGLLKKNPVNVYEIPNNFSIEEDSYLRLADQLYGYIRQLREEFIKAGEEAWTNVTITIADAKFKLEYRYEELIGSKYSSYDRHVIWQYQYLQYPIERLPKEQKQVVENYMREEATGIHQTKTYIEGIYQKDSHNNINYHTEEPDTYIVRKKEIEPKKKYGEYKKVEYKRKEEKKAEYTPSYIIPKVVKEYRPSTYEREMKEEDLSYLLKPQKKSQILNQNNNKEKFK